MSTQTNIRALPKHSGKDTESPLQKTLLSWFLPYPETQMVAQTSKGVFIPWPLLAIIVTLSVILISGLVTLQVQVSNLSTTLLLRDADHARQVEDIKKELVKESERRELSDLKIADLRERMAAAKIPERKN